MKPNSTIFQWTCLAAACVFGSAILYVVLDLKSDVTSSLDKAQVTLKKANSSIDAIGNKLPKIVDQVKNGTETLSNLAEDVELIKSIAGITSQHKGSFRQLAVYAQEIQMVLQKETEGKQAVIMIEEIFGSDLVVNQSMEEFLVGLNKEMISVILPLSKSKKEILYRVCHSSPLRRKPFFIRIGEQEPISLESFLRKHHPVTASIPVEKK